MDNKSQIKVYHYTRIDNWNGIKSGSYKTDDKPGLGPDLYIGSNVSQAQIRAVFALLDPIPETWRNNRYFPETWERLKSRTGNLLLEIDVEPNKNIDFVIDRGHMESMLGYAEGQIPKQYRHKTIYDAEMAMMKTRVPLRNYLRRKNELKYSLPEVIIPEFIPLERVHISQQQPFMEETLRRFNDGSRPYSSIMDAVSYIPELQPWYENYNQHNNESQNQLKGFHGNPEGGF